MRGFADGMSVWYEGDQEPVDADAGRERIASILQTLPGGISPELHQRIYDQLLVLFEQWNFPALNFINTIHRSCNCAGLSGCSAERFQQIIQVVFNMLQGMSIAECATFCNRVSYECESYGRFLELAHEKGLIE